MSLATFPRFSELARELQMMIWRYAATPERPLDPATDIPATRDDVDIDGMHLVLYKVLGRVEPFSFDYVSNRSIQAAITRETRYNLKNTCRLARLMVLEAWRNDIQAYGGTISEEEVLKRRNSWEKRRHQGYFHRSVFDHRRLLELLGIFIQAVKQAVAYDLPSQHDEVFNIDASLDNHCV